MPFERQFASQSLCKCDRRLPDQDHRKARYFECSVFLFATDYRHIFCSSWSRGINEKSRKEICIDSPKSVFLKIVFSELYEHDIERARYCQEHRESVNMKTFDQPEHDTRIWNHAWNGGIKGMSPGSAALSPFPSHRYFSYLTPFFPFSPTEEPGPRLGTILHTNHR